MTAPIDPRDGQANIPQQPAPAQTQPAEPTPAAGPPQRPARRWPWVVAAAAVVLVVAGGAAWALMPGDEGEAVDRCQAAVSDKLKSPSTAEYGDVTVTSEDGNFGTYYVVTGEVDAQNGFGATVRGEYRCKVNRESDGNWLVVESSFTQR
ncbi:hypothetical protein AB0J20_16215 [Micromonospora costi]|uniref:hypothetical protein n=1 Tax=Micromonospora costi TaxID=1530042 RepID=UPI0033D8CB4D